MIIHQAIKHAHGRMALQLAIDVHLHHIAPFPLLDHFRQHQFRRGTGILRHTTFEEVCPVLLLLRQVLVAFLQHR
ncbi:hypothetical protein D3C78_1656180 [compost metagenome]